MALFSPQADVARQRSGAAPVELAWICVQGELRFLAGKYLAIIYGVTHVPRTDKMFGYCRGIYLCGQVWAPLHLRSAPCD